MAAPPTTQTDAPFREGYTLSACPACGTLVAHLTPGTGCVTPVLGLAHGCQGTERSTDDAD